MIPRNELKKMIKDALLEVLTEAGVINSGEDALIGVEEAGRLLKLSRATIYEKTSQRQLPFYKKGKKIVFKKSELMAWLESGKVTVEIDADIQSATTRYLQSMDLRRRKVR